MADIDHATDRPPMERWLADDHDAIFYRLKKYHDYQADFSGTEDNSIDPLGSSASVSATHPSQTSLPSLSTGSTTSESAPTERSAARTVTTSRSSPSTADLARVVNQTSEILDVLPFLTTFQELVNFTGSWINSTVLERPPVENISSPTDGGIPDAESQQDLSRAANDSTVADGLAIQSGRPKEGAGGKRKRSDSSSSVHDEPSPSRRRLTADGSESRAIPCVFEDCKSRVRDWKEFRFLL